MIELIRSMWRRLLMRAAVEVLEEVDDIVADFDAYVDRLRAAAHGHLVEAESLSQQVMDLEAAAQRHESQAARAEAVAERLKNLVS